MEYLGLVAIVILFARDFHLPFTFAEIRYATIPNRYALALSTYVIAAVISYLVFKGLALVLLLNMYKESGLDLAYSQAPFISFSVLLLAPCFPVSGKLVRWFRGMMQRLARYPQSAEIVTALLVRSRLEPLKGTHDEIKRELDRYGVPRDVVATALDDQDTVLSAAAGRNLHEVCSLRRSLVGLGDNPRFRKFIHARSNVIDNLELGFRRLMRVSARAILLAEDIGSLHKGDKSNVLPKDAALEISSFVADQGNSLGVLYRRLLADASLSSFFRAAAREGFLRGQGFQVELPPPLPVAPLVTVFALDGLLAIVPALAGLLPRDAPIQPLDALITGFSHALALTLSVFLATYPPAKTNFARPSLFSLPWPSYILFAGIAYVGGVAITGVGFNLSHLPSTYFAAKHPTIAALYFSLMFPAITITLSILLDLRLRDPHLGYKSLRLRDALIVMVVMSLIIALLLPGLRIVGSVLRSSFLQLGMSACVFFIVVYGVLGFIIGWIVPSVAQAYIQAKAMILSRVTGQTGVADSVAEITPTVVHNSDA